MSARTLATLWAAPQLTLTLEWKLEDAWVGAFWRRTRLPPLGELAAADVLEVWVCLVPCLPLHFTIEVRRG